MEFADILDDAREFASSGNFRGDYLTSDRKDEMVRSGEPFWIFDVDSRPNKFEADKEQWVVTVGFTAEYDEDALSLLTLSSNEWRDRFFEKLVEGLAVMPDGSAIGPCQLVKIKTKSGSRAFDIVKWAPSVQRPAAAPAIQPTSMDETSEVDKPKRGRPSKVEQMRRQAQEAAAAARTASVGTQAPNLSVLPQEAATEVAPQAIPANERPAGVPANQPVGSGVSNAARTASTTCPDCNEIASGPRMQNGDGEWVILHNCVAMNGRPTVLKVSAA